MPPEGFLAAGGYNLSVAGTTGGDHRRAKASRATDEIVRRFWAMSYPGELDGAVRTWLEGRGQGLAAANAAMSARYRAGQGSAGIDLAAKDLDLAIPAHRVHMGVADAEAAGDGLEACVGHLIHIADGTVDNAADTAERTVEVAVHLALDQVVLGTGLDRVQGHYFVIGAGEHDDELVAGIDGLGDHAGKVRGLT